ncbi:MAG TPA: heparin lyase I family protein, partial [Kofleriaceae bacterium]
MSIGVAGCAIGGDVDEGVDTLAVSSDARLVGLIDFELQDTTAKFVDNSNRECFHDCAGGGFREIMATEYPDAFKVVSATTGKVRTGSRAARLAIDSRLSYDDHLGSHGIGKPRVDLSLHGDDKIIEYHEDAWLGFSIYFPESHVFATGNTTFGVGLHEIQRAGDNPCYAGGGPIGIGELGDEFRFSVRYAATFKNCQDGVYQRSSYTLGKIPKGKWTDFVVHYQLCA